MGEMTIRLDEATLLRLEARARGLGIEPSDLVPQLLAGALAKQEPGLRSAVARAIQATQPAEASRESASFIREDRDRR